MNAIFENYLKKLDSILISSRANILYLTNYVGFSETERECFLLITKNLSRGSPRVEAGKAGKRYLVTDKRYSQAISRQTKNFEIIDTGALSFIAKDAKELFEKEKIKTIGFEDYDLTVSEYSKLKRLAKTQKIDLRNLRIVKQKDEIENIRKACEIGDFAFSYIIKQLSIGITERKLADKLETFINSKGADFSFKPIVAFGPNSSIPHHVSGQTKLKRNQIVLFDFGVKVNNYCSDMSRTLFFGIANKKFKEMHKVVLSAQQKAIEFIQNFYSSSERGESRSLLSTSSSGKLFARNIDKIARNYIVRQGYPTIPHSLGHGVGLEVHEPPHLSPNSKDILKPNMVFSIEPGIYIPGFGGVRIEDLVLITPNGAQLISHSKREIIEI